AALNGRAPDAGTIAECIGAIRAAITPPTDLHASAAYRRHLAGVLAARAIGAAWQRAGQQAGQSPGQSPGQPARHAA
ncbi:MAG: hypothetical protein ACREFY_01260, partial [Acetobacteraceae bacterium]